jgi:hypothetical protein
VALWFFGERLYLLIRNQGQLSAEWSDPDITVLIVSQEQDPQTSNVLLDSEWARLPTASGAGRPPS